MFQNQSLKNLLVISISLTASASWAVTLNPSNKAQTISIESMAVECSEPGQECPKLPLTNIHDISYIAQDEEYTLNEEVLVASEEGLLVQTLLEESEDAEETEGQVQSRFIPLAKVELSPDENFYMCGKGGEFTLSSKEQLTTMGLEKDELSYIFDSSYEPQSFVCKCFWAPKTLFDELDLDKKKTIIEQKKDVEEPIFDKIYEAYYEVSTVEETIQQYSKNRNFSLKESTPGRFLIITGNDNRVTHVIHRDRNEETYIAPVNAVGLLEPLHVLLRWAFSEED